MEQFDVTGMSCAACSARVEKAVGGVPGVTGVSVSLLTNSMSVEGTASPQEIIRAVEKAGYGASRRGKNKETAAEEADLDPELSRLKRRLVVSVCILAVLMYITMGHKMWGWPLPEVLAANALALALSECLLTIAIMVVNQKFFVSGSKGLVHGAPNMDTLVALGAGAAFVYSIYDLYAMTYAVWGQEMELAHHYLHDLYFESAGTILTLITVGKTLEAYSKGRTKDALRELMKLSPANATLLRDGAEVSVPIEQVQKGDVFVVHPGESIPVDGVILTGHASVNEAALTGESIPVDKAQGDFVSAATINQDGYLTCEAKRVGEDTTLSKIIQMVSDAAATKAPIARIADKVSGVFVPCVMGIALLTLCVWLLVGKDAGFALARAISVLVISCPCALGLATPVAIMVGNGKGARNGILFKNAVSLEETGKAEIIVLDKTGTVTKGEPAVTDIIPAKMSDTDAGEGAEKAGGTGKAVLTDEEKSGKTEKTALADVDEAAMRERLLGTALALESHSEHPLAKAILKYGEEHHLTPSEIEEFKAAPGNGLTGVLDGKKVAGGKAEFAAKMGEIPDWMQERAEELAEEGKTPLYFMEEDTLLGCIAVADIIREESPQAISELKNMGFKVVMLTGDHERTARAIGKRAGVDRVIANVLPQEKEREIRRLKEQGKVIMVGDGINDAPALTTADIGIAIGAGTDVAVEAADVVLMKSSLLDIPAAIRLSRRTLTNIHQNLFWAFFYNTVGIPLAAGVWIPIFGWQLNPMFGAAAMGLSSFCVVSNALRLNLVDIRSTKHDRHSKGGKRKMAEQQEGQENAIEVQRQERSQETAEQPEKPENSIEVQKPERSRETAGAGQPEKPENVMEVQQPERSRETVGAGQPGYIENEMNTWKENGKMEKVMKIEGMMCGHCEGRVQKTLEAIDGVESAQVSHESGEARLTLSADVADDVLKRAVEAQDYKVLEIC